MPGHMGSKRVTTQNLRVMQVRAEENLILIKDLFQVQTGAL